MIGCAFDFASPAGKWTNLDSWLWTVVVPAFQKVLHQNVTETCLKQNNMKAGRKHRVSNEVNQP